MIWLYDARAPCASGLMAWAAQRMSLSHLNGRKTNVVAGDGAVEDAQTTRIAFFRWR